MDGVDVAVTSSHKSRGWIASGFNARFNSLTAQLEMREQGYGDLRVGLPDLHDAMRRDRHSHSGVFRGVAVKVRARFSDDDHPEEKQRQDDAVLRQGSAKGWIVRSHRFLWIPRW